MIAITNSATPAAKLMFCIPPSGVLEVFFDDSIIGAEHTVNKTTADMLAMDVKEMSNELISAIKESQIYKDLVEEAEGEPTEANIMALVEGELTVIAHLVAEIEEEDTKKDVTIICELLGSKDNEDDQQPSDSADSVNN